MGTLAHTLDIFLRLVLRLTREIDDYRRNFGIFFRGNGPRYSYQIFTTDDPWGSPYSALDILTLTPKNFEKLGKNFFGGGGPRAPWGKILGIDPKLKTASTRGSPRVQNKIVSGPLAQSTTAQ